MKSFVYSFIMVVSLSVAFWFFRSSAILDRGSADLTSVTVYFFALGTG